MPPKAKIPLKPKMPKKSEIPQAISREVIGKANNKRYDKNKSEDDQARLNYIANNIGQTLAPDSLLTLDGFLFLYSICQNARLVDPLEQQPIIKKKAPAFEATTRIDVRREGNQTRIYSFVSTSTINRERIQPLNTSHTMPHQSTSIALPFISASPFFGNQTFYHPTSTSTQSAAIDVAKMAHELSVFVHQKVHDLYQLVNCTTIRRTDQVNTLILTGESVEQTSFTTVCQEAIGKAETQNNQGMQQESEHTTFSSHYMTNSTEQGFLPFSAEETAQKLSKAFQASFENQHNTTRDSLNHVHNQVTETFWNGLTKLFYQFFSQHEHVAPTQEKKEPSGSLLSYFADWLLSTFSVNFGEQIPTNAQLEKKLNVPMSNHRTNNSLLNKTSQKKSKKKKQKNNQQELSPEMVPKSVSKAKTVLLPEGESYLSPFWHLAEDFFGKVDGFIEHFNFNVFPQLGAEARPIPAPVEEREVLISWKKLSVGTTIKINQIMSDYLNNLPSTVPNKGPLPDFWYDYETFQLRHKIQVVNQKVKDYLSEQGVPCAGLSGVELLNAIDNWEGKDGLVTKINRRKQLASVIREASGLPKIDLTYTQATNILFQWRNNNIFQEYSFEDRKPPTPKESQPTTLEELTTTQATTANAQTSATITTTLSPPEVDTTQLEYSEEIPSETQMKLEKVIQTYIHGYSFAKLLRETIPPNLAPFWYNLEVFKKRDQVEKVNKKVRVVVCNKGRRCRNMSAQTMFLEIRHWEKSKDAETVRTKKKKIADTILEASGLPARELTDPEVVAIILQWQNNNLFKSYKFKEIAPMRTETTVSLNENQSNVTIELPLETNSVKDQVEMASFSTTPSSSTSVKLSADALKINSIITAFFAGKSSPVPLSEKLPLFMDDVEVYKKRNETDHVNDKVKEFLCTQKEPCDGLSPLQLINALYWWVWKEGEEKKIARSKEVAEVILSSSGLAGQEVSDDRASTIIQQWRNNNIFKGYQFKEPKQIHTETTASVNETQSSPTTELPIEANSVVYQVDEVLPPTRPSTISEKPLEDIKKINSMITAFFEEKPSSVPISEKLPLFLYDEALYKKRNETQSMNDDVKKFLCEQKVTCEKLSSPQLIIATEEWVRKGKNKGKVARSKQVAEVIFNSSGIVGQEISDDRAATILLQWRENNIFQGYQFKYLMKRHNEPTTDGHQVITVVLNENQPNTTTHASQLKKGNGFNLPHSNITTGLPIDKRSDKSSTPKFQSPNTYNKRYLEFTEKINSIITAFLEGKPSPVPTTEIFPTCYHEGAYAVYQQRHETSKVNEAIKKFLCNQKIPCEGLSLLQLITATQGWIRKEGKEIEKTRSKEIAELILTSSGLASQKLSGFQANAIFLQWRNNNIFKDYKFHEPSSDARMIKNNEPVGMITYTNLYTYGVLSLEGAAMVNKFHMAYLNEHPLTLPTYEPILPFWYDFALFQKRNETAKANEAVILFLVKQQEFSEGLPSKPTAIIAHEWVHEKQTDAEILARQKQLALIILEGYGIRRNLTATEAVNTVLQWENNNVFKDYTFVELKQSALSEKQFRNEPLTENSKMGVVPDTIKDPDLEFVHEIVEDITNNITPTTRYSEPLPIFYYHLLLFQKRNETSAVNKKMQEFFTKEGIAVKESSSSELEKTTLQWLETGSTHDVSDKYERKQFLAYFLLKAYGVEDLRLGEFLSSTKVQAIFNQWKANTLLEGYTYQEITYTTIHHQLSKEEDPSVIRLNEQKKESHQIFADFIYDRTATISKNQSIQTIYYHRTLFEKREKTLAVNEAVRKFLLEQKVSLKNQSASELVRRMQGWIFEGPTYGTILKREEQVAQLLQKEYGLEEEERTVKEPRYLLLQWGNNNAQVGYSYKDTSTFEAIEISAIEANEEEKERIEAFTRENKVLSPTEDTSLGMEEKLPEWTEEQQENIRKKVITFLEARNIKMDASKPNELIIKIARWVTKEVEGKETTDFTKVKMLANIILGKKEEAVILEEKAQAILIKWLLDNIEEEAPTFTSTELTNQTIKTIETTSVQPSVSRKQIPKYEAPNWRDKNMMIQIAQFFRQEGVLKGESTIENILIAMGKWFTESGSGMSLSQGKLQTLSKVILKELNLYGGEGKEKISDKDTRLTIMKWVAENVLGSSIEGYMIKQILDSPNPSQFTIGHLRKLFEVEELRKGGYITLHTLRNVSKEEEEIVKKLWFLLLKDTLPNYFLETSTLADELPVSNYDSLMQLTGAKLLADLGIQTQFNQAEIQMLGTFIWDKISKNGIKRVEELRYTVLPALLAIAQLDPDLLREALEKGTYYEVALSTFIEYHQNGYLQLKEHHDTLSALFTAYQKEVLNWRRKQALAKEVVQTYLQHAKGQLVYKAFVLEQDYLLGKSLSINDYTSPDLGEWYKRLTKAVSDSFYPLDQKLIEFALAAFDPEEREFMFSPETELYEASAVFENTEFLPDTLMGDPIPIILKTTSKLEQTDLFVAVQGDEKRWYALKKLEREGGYIFYRVDKNSMDYLKYGLMDHKDIWSQGYKREGNAIRVGKRLFMFVPTIDQSKKLSQGEDMQPLIDAFSRKHSDKLYDDLYQSGDDKAILEQIWDVAKHIIPFYDCVTASIDKDVAVAVPSCTIDIVLLIPVFGQMTSLSSKFAFGMAKAMAKGGIRNAIRQGPRFTPKLSEIKSVLINIRRYLDPGIESITDGSKFVIRELVDLKNEVWVKKNVKQLLGKIDGLVKKTPTLPKDVIRTYLPGKGLEVPVKRMKDKSYLLVTNLETGDVYGRPFLLRGNRLEIFSGPVSFTEEQKALINRLASGIDPDQVFVVEPNLNSNAYGSGEVMSVLEAGKETRYFITLNGQKVPVRVTSIEEHGVRYDVVDGEKIYPVNYNGKEWYFEPATSPFISKEMADEVMKKMDEFESIEDPSTLSAPDEKELMWNRMGRSYIKINDHYIPLIELYEGGSHYNLVQKDVLRPMTVLVFDPENEQFRFETDLEKKRWEKSIKSILWGADALNLRDTEFPPANKIPNSAGRSEEWNKFREAEKYENKGSRVEDDSIPFQQLAQFMPEAKALVHNGLEWHTKNILNDILEILPEKPKLDFWVYIGLEPNNVPDYIKLFQEDLAKEYAKAQNYYETVEGICQNLLIRPSIAETKEGQYLAKMFKLEGLQNKEHILREAVQRLSSVTKKGARFLQKTAEWGFENIWIVSTKLIQKGPKKYFSSYNEVLSTQAYIPDLDPECRIIFFADAFHANPDLAPDENVIISKSETTIHETTHVVSATTDLLRYSKLPKGFTVKSGKMLMEEYNKKKQRIFKKEGFEQFVEQLAEYQNTPTLSRNTVWNALDTDHVLRVNLQMTDAEILMVIIRDFAEERDFEGIVRVARSLNDQQLGNGFRFLLSSLTYMNNYDYFEKDSELNKTQEQITDISDGTSATTEGSDRLTNEKKVKREIASTTKGFTKNIYQSFSNLVTMSIERSTSTQSNPKPIYDRKTNKYQKELSLQH